MSPEYGATIAICPIDDMTLDYLRLTSRDDAHVELVEAYAKEQGLFRTAGVAGSGLHARRSSSICRPSSRAWPARSGRRIACRCGRRSSSSSRRSKSMLSERKPKAVAGPQSRARQRAGGRSVAGGRRPSHGRRRAAGPRRARPRRGRRRRDHELHQHLEPERHDRRRPARAERRQARADGQAVGQDQPRARLADRHRVLQGGRPARVPRRARLQHRRLRLHDLHRQQRSAARARCRRSSRTRTSSSRRC